MLGRQDGGVPHSMCSWALSLAFPSEQSPVASHIKCFESFAGPAWKVCHLTRILFRTFYRAIHKNNIFHCQVSLLTSQTPYSPLITFSPRGHRQLLARPVWGASPRKTDGIQGALSLRGLLQGSGTLFHNAARCPFCFCCCGSLQGPVRNIGLHPGSGSQSPAILQQPANKACQQRFETVKTILIKIKSWII